MVGESIVYLILFLAVIIGLFLLLREFWCWFWKINTGISLLESIEKKLSLLTNTEPISISDPKPTLETISHFIASSTAQMKKEPTPTSTEGMQEEFLHHCDNCDKGIKGTTYYCAECDIYVCYDCMLMGAKCPKCKTKLEKV